MDTYIASSPTPGKKFFNPFFSVISLFSILLSAQLPPQHVFSFLESTLVSCVWVWPPQQSSELLIQQFELKSFSLFSLSISFVEDFVEHPPPPPQQILLSQSVVIIFSGISSKIESKFIPALFIKTGKIFFAGFEWLLLLNVLNVLDTLLLLRVLRRRHR